jgi:SAM-dependent methyltransferase
MQVKDRLGDSFFQLSKCTCGFVFLSPRPELDVIGDFYSHSSYDPHKSKRISVFDTLYSLVQFLSLKWKFNILSKYTKGSDSPKLLDIGGGQGEFCSYFYDKGWEVHLQDSHSSVNTKKFPIYNSLSQLEGQTFDIITMWHSLEHIHNIDTLFKQINKLLKPNGHLVIAVPNRHAIERPFFGHKWAPWDAPRHLYHFNFLDVELLLRQKGFKMKSSKSMLQDTPYNILLSLDGGLVRKLLRGAFILLYSYIGIFLNGIQSSSSFMVVCSKD